MKSRDLKTRSFLSGVEEPVSRIDFNKGAEEIVQPRRLASVTSAIFLNHLPCFPGRLNAEHAQLAKKKSSSQVVRRNNRTPSASSAAELYSMLVAQKLEVYIHEARSRGSGAGQGRG
jgi:hypothetical protein